ncbi:hypothetical protein DSO57_1013004 [Entomophthora muscae]|uniref:Uncharacterized protein n=1 Tax=Entomophthora muscae TaxID=34485 RepID=A0ACC2UQM1_9FUNG|nr:hypothetical protein DSO57_1013004 [Entomophthora muscae]
MRFNIPYIYLLPLTPGVLPEVSKLFEDIPGRALGLLATSENLDKSLTFDDLDLLPPGPVPQTIQKIDFPKPSPSTESKYAAPVEEVIPQEYAPKKTPWLLGGILLMGLDSYFP